MMGPSSRVPLGWVLVPTVIVAALVAILIGVSLYSGSVSPSSYYWSPFYRWWFGGPFFGWLFFIPLLFLVFLALRWFFWPWGCGRGWYGEQYDPALDTLRQRFAKGEITKEQFEQMRRELN